ncbi:hypothetical protein ACHAXA_008985 [Cyclostephanos tholiformis]|uniref:Uncharacterized protein n=1 Tax=Cyclostephanos tholiformis TaxID=382380 RepID=A0ABD3RKY5_9STRA
MKNTCLAVVLLALPNPVGAFTTAGRSAVWPVGRFRLILSTQGGGWDGPSPGGWDNDDYLNGLGGGGGGGGGGGSTNEDYGYEQRRVVPENGMTDEEITMMAMRAAQYYNTDAPIEEVYAYRGRVRQQCGHGRGGESI